MMITVNNYESKKYDVESKSIIKMHDLTEIMQINNIIEHSIEQKDRSGYEVFIDILETNIIVNQELKPMQKIALNLYFLTEEVKLLTDREMNSIKVINKEQISKKWE